MTIGDNQPDLASEIRSRLDMDHVRTREMVALYAAESDRLPDDIQTKEEHDKCADFVSRIRGTYKNIEAERVAEKDPYLKAERAIDGFFDPFKKELGRIGSLISNRVEAYLQRKAAEERRQREEAARIEREKAEALRREEAAQRAKQELAARKAAEANRATARAKAEVQAVAARQAAEVAAAEAREAEVAADDREQFAQARPADLARTRSDRGTLSTLKSVWVAKIEDAELIPLETLRPYISADVIEKAVNAFVKIGGRQLPGVRIYETEKGVIR